MKGWMDVLKSDQLPCHASHQFAVESEIWISRGSRMYILYEYCDKAAAKKKSKKILLGLLVDAFALHEIGDTREQ